MGKEIQRVLHKEKCSTSRTQSIISQIASTTGTKSNNGGHTHNEGRTRSDPQRPSRPVPLSGADLSVPTQRSSVTEQPWSTLPQLLVALPGHTPYLSDRVSQPNSRGVTSFKRRWKRGPTCRPPPGPAPPPLSARISRSPSRSPASPTSPKDMSIFSRLSLLPLRVPAAVEDPDGNAAAPNALMAARRTTAASPRPPQQTARGTYACAECEGRVRRNPLLTPSSQARPRRMRQPLLSRESERLRRGKVLPLPPLPRGNWHGAPWRPGGAGTAGRGARAEAVVGALRRPGPVLCHRACSCGKGGHGEARPIGDDSKAIIIFCLCISIPWKCVAEGSAVAQ